MASVIERAVDDRIFRKIQRGKVTPTNVEAQRKKVTTKAKARKARSKTPKTINPQNLAGARRLLRDPKKFDEALKKGLF